MRFADEFRDPELAAMLGRQITSLCEPGRHYKIMEVCGGHTHTIYRYGVQDHLP
ncbi:MAG: hypD, partial [Mycobacterium sp.]|nr:hypD [Mycobacterium sp.]